MSYTKQILIFLLLVSAAACLRFYRLGDWSFMGDELYTRYETQLFFGEIQAEYLDSFIFLKDYYDPEKMSIEDSQIYRLPRLVPLAYILHWIDYQFFGTDEFGSRFLMALIGSLNVGVLFLLGRPLLGDTGALILSALILCFPEHIFHSQNARMYVPAYLLISIVFLLGGYIAENRSVRAAVWIGPITMLLILTHTLGGIIWGILLAGLLADYCVSKRTEEREYPKSIGILLFGWTLLFVAFALFYIHPLISGWNAGRIWNYTSVHFLLAMVARIGWPLFLISSVGSLYAFFHIRGKNNAYWIATAFLSVAIVLVFPHFHTFYPWHIFIFTFPFFFIAARFIANIHSGLGRQDSVWVYRLCGAAWIAFAAVVNLPATFSYYLDGNRLDFRSACNYVSEHWQDGDILASAYVGFAEHYLPKEYPKQALWTASNVEFMEKFGSVENETKGRIWIIDYTHRGGLHVKRRLWLFRHAEPAARFGKKRLDHIDNNVDVYLLSPRKKNEQAEF